MPSLLVSRAMCSAHPAYEKLLSWSVGALLETLVLFGSGCSNSNQIATALYQTCLAACPSASAVCSQAPLECAAYCQEAAAYPSCQSSLSEYLQCGARSGFSCDSTESAVPSSASCASERTALLACLQGATTVTGGFASACTSLCAQEEMLPCRSGASLAACTSSCNPAMPPCGGALETWVDCVSMAGASCSMSSNEIVGVAHSCDLSRAMAALCLGSSVPPL